MITQTQVVSASVAGVADAFGRREPLSGETGVFLQIKATATVSGASYPIDASTQR
jgi:hypothetical protein